VKSSSGIRPVRQGTLDRVMAKENREREEEFLGIGKC
jgi:hypothetical protein